MPRKQSTPRERRGLKRKLPGMKTLRALQAHLCGYTVTRDGSVLSPTGKSLRLLRTASGYGSFSFNGRRFGLGLGEVHSHKLQAIQKYGAIVLDPEVLVFHQNGDKSDASYDNIIIGGHGYRWDRKSEDEKASIVERRRMTLVRRLCG